MTEVGDRLTIDGLCQDYGWLRDGEVPDVLYCPVTRQTGVHAISMVHAMGGIVARRAGIRVVYAMESSTVDVQWQSAMERWFGKAGLGDALPEFMPLTSSGDSAGAELAADPADFWAIARRAAGLLQDRAAAEELVAALKIAPLDVLKNGSTALSDWASRSSRRLDTLFLVTAGMMRLTAEVDHPSKIMTLGGDDERPFWRLWDGYFAPSVDRMPGHLYFPRVVTKSPDQPLSWPTAADLAWSLERSMPSAEWEDPNDYAAWLFRQLYRLGQIVFENDSQKQAVESWPQLVAEIAGSSEARHKVASTITRLLWDLPAEPADRRTPRLA